MEATDFLFFLLSVAKEVSKIFVDSAPIGVKVGVISFSGSSKIEQDVTERKDEIRRAIDGIEIGSYGGTDIYEAVLTSNNLLKLEEHKAAIILSDGRINVGSIDEAVDFANGNGMLVHSIGMGTIEGGETEYSYSKLDEDSLKSISYNTRGNYAHGINKTALSRAFLDIYDLTEKKVSIALVDYLVLLGLVLLIIIYLFSNTRFVTLP
jgi:Ca-activated chloride channel family protein